MNNELLSVVVVPRDRFSTTTKCLDALLAHTPEPHELLVVLGGASEKFKKELIQRYSGKARFLFEPSFLGPPQSRNIALKAVRTRLAAIVENDVIVRPGWLTALLKCQKETGAAMVVPLILEDEETIHTAGNGLYRTHRNGIAFGSKELKYYKQAFYGSSNLKRERTDYGELHCQLVEVEPAIRLGVFDEHITEAGECDSGLSWTKGGRELWFEPASVAIYDLPKRIVHVEDIRFFAWRWDMRTILDGYRYFEKKWNLDISEFGNFKHFLLQFNGKCGLLPRLLPSRTALRLDQMFVYARRTAEKSLKVWTFLRGWLFGYYEWTAYDRKPKAARLK
jgi:GT2 family glycosyltransferase